MHMISFRHKGNFVKLSAYLNSLKKIDYKSIIDKYAQAGVDALRSATPIDSGLTAESWGYEIEDDGKTTTVTWYNTNVNNGVNVAIILQYGHGTGTGGYVEGYDYINPAIVPVFDNISEGVWKEVTKL